MATLLYLVHGRAPRQQQQLSYSILSALKQGLEGVEILLMCDEANRRPDLPVRHQILSVDQIAQWTDAGRAPARAQLHALQLALSERTTPVCWVATDTAFTAPPRQMTERIAAQVPLFYDRDGWLAGRPEWAPIIDACKGTALEDQIQTGTEVLDTGILGLTEAESDIINQSLKPHEALNTNPKVSNIEQIRLGALLTQTAREVRFGNDTVSRYSTYMRHVYHGRFDAMFPPGAPVNTALAERLPVIKEPPKPLHLRLKAKAYALRHGLGRGTEFGYLAYLCAFAAPTPEGRNVWANIALDMIERSPRAPDKLAKDLPGLAPDALTLAELSPETEDRWRTFWMNITR
ncbi:hypothetical protein [Epibacterium sp. Ofav1-8]|uniref:hypothetical protein n=1 Tax=Epibacterium sp. Ofav1-8 TaxID=2917735 RepID=UPI001EF492AD|nr:hypothetical protein [Epibacterium sp. Ofav1-8]MCG7624319.1 hypothetical protein [Epibacterium sp. Ofav1-8]